MECPSLSAPAGASAVLPAHRPRPSQVKEQFFEHFTGAGAVREVLLLGDVVEYEVHYITEPTPAGERSRGHMKLCKAAHGPCELCAQAAASPFVREAQTEYAAPAMARKPREKEFRQRVIVLPRASATKLTELFPLGQMRGKYVVVTRLRNRQLGYVEKPGLPAGLPRLLPAAFDVLPFVRARHGLPQEPGRPMVFLDPLAADDGPAGGPRPARLGLTQDDFDDLRQMPRDQLLALIARYEEHGWPRSAERARKVYAERFGVFPEPPRAEPPATIPITAALPVVEEVGVQAEGPQRVPLAGFPPEAYGPKTVAREGVPADATATPAPKLLADKAIEALARRRQQAGKDAKDPGKPLVNPDAVEAVAFGAIEEYVLGRAGAPIPAHLNGAAAAGKKGGGR